MSRPTGTGARRESIGRVILSVLLACGAAGGIGLVAASLAAARQGQATDRALGKLAYEADAAHGAIRRALDSGDLEVFDSEQSFEAAVDRGLRDVRTQVIRDAPGRLTPGLQGVIGHPNGRAALDRIERDRRAYVAAVQTIGGAPTEQLPAAIRALDMREKLFLQGVEALRDEVAAAQARAILVTETSAAALIALCALTAAYFIWRPAFTSTSRQKYANGRQLQPISQPAALIDKHGIVKAFEGGADTLLAGPGEPLVGVKLLSLIVPADAPMVEKFLRRCVENPRTAGSVDFRPSCNLRSWYSMEAAGGRRKGDVPLSGSVVRFIDATPRKQAEEALNQSTELVRTLIEAAPLAIMIEDLAGRIRLCNSAANRMFGWAEDGIVGQENPTIPKDLLDGHRHLREQILRGEAYTALESQRIRADGSLIDVSMTAAPVRDGDGTISGVMDVMTDITERKQLEAQLRQAQKMEGIGRLAGGIAHDFNNLLTVIVGHTELLLRRTEISGATRECGESEPETLSAIHGGVKEIHKAAERAAALTQQLLAFSRNQVLQPQLLSVNTAVLEMEEMLRRLIGEDIDLAIIPAPDADRIKADPTQISQVIMNVVLNARDALSCGGKITIETANVELDEGYSRKRMPVIPGRYVLFAVSDNGVGMDKETQARIFEPFFTTKERGKGTGLGLATVYGIVRQSGGYIWVYSEIGHGTTLKIYLPSAEERGSETVGPAEVPQMVADGSETVLLVEDEEMVRTLVRQVLTWHGYKVIEAHSGEEAVIVARDYPGPIHLMLTDLVMAGMNGLDAVKTLAPTRPQMKVLYMSGYTDHAVVRNNLLTTEHAFLQKPFAPDRLAHKIREVLAQPGRHGQPAASSMPSRLPDAARLDAGEHRVAPA